MLAGCAATTPSGPSSLVPFRLDLMRVIDGATDEPAIARLAPVETATAPNRHVPEASITYRTYVFDRTRVTFLDARPVSRLFIESVETWDPAVRTPAGIGVGSSRAEVEAAYGAYPDWSDGARAAFYYSDADGLRGERLSLVVNYGQDGRATRIELLWDID